jgi:hypothetical protein
MHLPAALDDVAGDEQSREDVLRVSASRHVCGLAAEEPAGLARASTVPASRIASKRRSHAPQSFAAGTRQHAAHRLHLHPAVHPR